jgi:hypothetical protein
VSAVSLEESLTTPARRSRRLLLNARLSAQRQCGHDPAILEGRCEWYLYWRLDQVPSRGRKDIGETLEQCVLREAYKDVRPPCLRIKEEK